MVEICLAVSPIDLDECRELIREYTAWAFAEQPDAENVPAFRGLEEELAGLPGLYSPPRGRLLLARSAGKPAGCFALKPRDEGTGEFKRLYVRPGFRGENIGLKLTERLVEEARNCGYLQIVLGSHKSMTRAHEIYEQVGFQKVPPPAGTPETLTPDDIFMELILAPDGSGLRG
jgi:GNAT superfamily N-acetyltransferase